MDVRGAGPGAADRKEGAIPQGAETSRAVWFKYYPARWAALAMREPDNTKLGEKMRRIILALCEQERGADAFADVVMQSTAEAMQAASDHARKAAKARWSKPNKECPSNARASDRGGESCPSNAKRRDLEDEKRGDISTEPKKGTAPESASVRESVNKSLGIGNSRGDLKGTIACLSHDELPQWAADYCQEADPNYAIRTHKKMIRTIGPEAFRSELDSFVGDVEAGEEPQIRGRAFTARLNALVNAKGEKRKETQSPPSRITRNRAASANYQAPGRPYDNAF